MRSFGKLVLLGLIALCSSLNAQWVQTSGPFGGSIFALAINPANSNEVFAGGPVGGVFRSTDKGTTWTQVNSGLTDMNVYSLCFSDTGHLFAGTLNTGVFVSTNHGASWSPANTGISNGSISSLEHIGNWVYAALHGVGVYVSRDNGTSWTAAGLTNLNINVLHFATDTTLYAGIEGGGVYRTTDRGAIWTQLNSGLTNTQVRALYSTGTVTAPVIFAGTYGGGVFISTNNGTNWSSFSSGLSVPYVNALNFVINGTFYGPLIAGSDGGGIYRAQSTTWSQSNNGLINLYERSLATDMSGTVYMGNDGGGVFVSTDAGASWNTNSTGMTSSGLLSFATSGSNLYAGTYGAGVFLSTDNGATWTPRNSGLTAPFVYALLIDGGMMYAGTASNSISGGVFRSTDGGLSWTNVNSGLTNIAVISLARVGTNLFAGTLGGVFVSADSGNSWTAVNNGIVNLNLKVDALVAIGDTLFAGTTGVPQAVYRSTDNGTTWSATNIGWSASYGTAVYAFLLDGTNLYAGVTQLQGSNIVGAVYKTTDEGTSWTLVSGSTNTQTVRSLVLANSTLIAGTDGNGVIEIKNNSWNAVNTGLPNSQVFALASLNTTLFAGTNLSGVWKRPLSEVTAIDEVSNQLPATFSLSQNYPNPFNPSTTIKFSISQAGLVTLKVYDILGRQVATLVNEEKPAGSYEVEFNPARLSSGIYFYSIRSGNFSETKKMIFMK
jgi:photosystem II stability/assembly factor-like uncharacterized protein